jgi:hypothetical protein
MDRLSFFRFLSTLTGSYAALRLVCRQKIFQGTAATRLILVHRALFPAVLLLAWQSAAPGRCADRLILRNLDIISDRTVTALDDDGVVLDKPRPSGESRIAWDQIERGKVGVDQSRFDALLAELGPPLYRIRQRLKIGDYEGAGEPAEALYARFVQRKSQTAYLVCQATLWSRLAASRCEAAVEPYLRCFELLRSKAATSAALPGTRRLVTDPTTAISSELLPIWFDRDAASAALAEVQHAIRDMSQPRPAGAYVYYATLAIAAGQTNEAERVLPLISSDDQVPAPWRDIVLAQQELATDSAGPAMESLQLRRDILPEPSRPVALFLVGKAALLSKDPDILRDGLLALLTLPAVYSSQQPELVAAGLYHAAGGLDKLNDTAGASAVRHELAGRYSGTFFGVKSAAESRK